MNLIWRFLFLIFFTKPEPSSHTFTEGEITFYVLPTDVDILMHMNNGRYFSLMDLARIDLMIKSGAFAKFRKNNIYPVIASEMIRFKKSIKLFQKFVITTKIIGWDDKFFYLTQYFKVGHEIHALGVIKARFLTKDGTTLSPQEVLNVIDIKDSSSPIMPSWIADWQQADQKFYDETFSA